MIDMHAIIQLIYCFICTFDLFFHLLDDFGNNNLLNSFTKLWIVNPLFHCFKLEKDSKTAHPLLLFYVLKIKCTDFIEKLKTSLTMSSWHTKNHYNFIFNWKDSFFKIVYTAKYLDQNIHRSSLEHIHINF